MKAAVIHQFGDPSVLRYEDFPEPTPEGNEVLVQVAAAGINPVDMIERSGGTNDWRPIHFPAVLGWDLSGTVKAIGPEVKSLAVGDRVLGWAYHTYAELCAIREDLLVKVPTELDLLSSAALPLAGMTGTQLVLQASRVQQGQTILVSGALGGVGRSAVYAAKERGAVVIAGVQKRQCEAAGELGVAQVLALDDPAALDAFEPIDVVANTVRGHTAEQLVMKVKAGGTFASVTGAPSNAANALSVRVVPFVSKQDQESLRFVVQGAINGKLQMPIGRRYPLSEAAKAHEAFESGSSGRLLLMP